MYKTPADAIDWLDLLLLSEWLGVKYTKRERVAFIFRSYFSLCGPKANLEALIARLCSDIFLSILAYIMIFGIMTYYRQTLVDKDRKSVV